MIKPVKLHKHQIAMMKSITKIPKYDIEITSKEGKTSSNNYSKKLDKESGITYNNN